MRLSTGFAVLLAMAWATSSYAVQPAVFETTLFGAYHYGGEFDDRGGTFGKLKLQGGVGYGVSLNLQQTEDAYYELNYFKQSAKIKDSGQYASVNGASHFNLDIEYIHVGGLVAFGDPHDRVVPYLLLTVGATRLIPTGADFRTVYEPSVAIGGGVKLPITKNVGFRVEARGYATFVDSDSKLYCSRTEDPAISCDILVQSATFLQVQALAGVTIGF